MILREIKNMYINRLTEIEYLESTGTQGIRTGINSRSGYFEAKITHLGGESNYYPCFFGKVENTKGSSDFGLNRFLLYRRQLGNVYILENGYRTTHISGTPPKTFTFPKQAWKVNSLYDYYDKEIEIFSVWGADPSNIKFYYLKLWDSSDNLVRDFIPVRVGQIGYLYDKVSNQLFGNSRTGNFVLGPDVNTGLQQIYQNKLIEGVDYETYDWLKADIPINTFMMFLPINSKNFEFKRNFIQLMNTGYFSTYAGSSKTYSYFLQDYYPKIYEHTLQRTIFIGNNLGSGVHAIIANDNGVTISSTTGTASLPWYGDPQYILFNNANNLNKNTIHLTSSISVDGVTRYVPCQLLHSIPRNLDAQCKERVAGECGMIDLISGKFYGNVASSGTFTVENDNNE